MKVSKLSDAIAYSNRMVEKLAKKIINESSNAVLLEMFENKVLLADHTNGNIYTADYKFDGNNFVFENFDHIELEADSDALKEAINNYFDEDVVDTSEIEEALEEEFEKEDNELSDSIVEALASKNTEDVIDYSEMRNINEEIDELKETKLFADYSALLEERPISTIHCFDFVNPVKVSVLDEDEGRVIYTNVSEKIAKSVKDTDIKNSLLEALKSYKETEDITVLEDFFMNNEVLTALTESQLKEFIGMSAISEPSILSERKELTNTILDLINENEYLCGKKELILEAAEEEENGTEEDEEDKKVSVSDADVEKLKKALKDASEKIEDEKLLEKINGLLTAIESSSANNETDVGAIKESIALFSL